MKKIVCLLAGVFACFQLFSQGVDFKSVSLKEALEQAKTQGKMVFVDCYTTWCGPCKMMTEQVFPQKEAGDFFNTHFVNVKFDMEKGEGKELSTRFKIRAYPTFLLLEPDGTERYRIVGGGDLEEFIGRVSRGLQEKNSLPVLEKEFKTGKMSKRRMLDLVMTLQDAYDGDRLKIVAEELVKRLTFKEKISAPYWVIYEDGSLSPLTSDNFSFLLKNKVAFEKNVGETKVNQKIASAYSGMLYSYVAGFAKKEDIARLDVMKQQLDEYDLPDKTYLQTKLALAYARCNEDIDQMITLLKKEIYNLPQGELWTLATSLDFVKKQGNKAQWQQVAELGDQFVEAAKAEDLKGYLKSYFSSFKKLASVGVYWEDLTLEQALKKAERGKRMVFVDCYTTWCGPCKYMTSNVFPQETVGDYFNPNFICLKIDMEKGEGPELVKRYGIRAFPTFLILRPDGSVYHKILGSGEADAFLKRVREGMEEEHSTGYLDKLYDEGNRDKDFLTRYVKSLLSIYEEDKAKEVSDVLLGLLEESEKVDSNYWFIFENPTLTSQKSDNFKYLIDYREAFIQSLGKKKIDNKLYSIYYNRLSYILKGYDKKSKVEDVVHMKKEIEPYKLEKKKELLACMKITEAYMEKDVKGLYASCKKGFKLFHDDEAMNIAFPVLKYLNSEMKEKNKFQELVNLLLANIENESLKEYLSKNMEG